MKALTLFLAAPLLWLAGAVYGDSVASDKVVAYFGATPIYAEELTLHIRDEVALVAVHFHTTHGVSLSGSNWRQRIGNEMPMELLEQRALNSCQLAKAIQSLAVEHGVGDELRFPGFSAYCAEWNRSRAAAKAEGKILFGPLEYSTGQLYKYRLGNMRNHLREALSRGDYERREAVLASAIQSRMDAQTVRVNQAELDALTAAQVGAE